MHIDLLPYPIGRLSAPYFCTHTNSCAYIVMTMHSWATLLGVCREDSRHEECMLLIYRQVSAKIRVLYRLHPKISTPKIVSRTSSTKGRSLGHTPTIHTPLPFANGFSFARPRGKILYTISPARAYIKFFQYSFYGYPLSLFAGLILW